MLNNFRTLCYDKTKNRSQKALEHNRKMWALSNKVNDNNNIYIYKVSKTCTIILNFFVLNTQIS